MTTVNAIVCVGPDNVIGIKDKLLWKSKKDLEYFKCMTIGNPCIFGATTYYGLPIKPLHERLNIVIDHTQESLIKANFEYGSIHTSCKGGYISVNKPELSLFFSSNYDDVFICGGASIYKYFFDNDLIDNFYINYITSPKIKENIFNADQSDLVKLPITNQDFINKGYIRKLGYDSMIEDEWNLPEDTDPDQSIQFSVWQKINIS